MFKKIGRSPLAQSLLAGLAIVYLRLVHATSRFSREPADFDARIGPDLPVIGAMWHGQHLMIHYAWPKVAKVAALISRHGDGEINAKVLERLGVVPIRGSGGSPDKMHKRGGMLALREMLRALANGTTMVLTADVPKVSRIAGMGIVVLAQKSGRPIYPLAVVTSRRIDLNSWDHASIGLPFSKGAIVIGDPIHVAADASAEQMEIARQLVEAGLNEVHRRAYAQVGSTDPGAPLADSKERSKGSLP
jgi:lysophospholipid acyltransferase (LPLAT)-like uncharacterized protein